MGTTLTSMKGLPSVCLYVILKSIAAQASSCNTFGSSYGNYLKNHVIQTSLDSSLQNCTTTCLSTDFCKSTNFNFVNNTCELSKADKFEYARDLVRREGFSYSGWRYEIRTSCAKIRKANLFAKSGYYTIYVRGKRRNVYCDMETFGGGWTLVVSISASNKDHLKTGENNCNDSLLCVKYSTSNIDSRKLSDLDIRALASAEEGTFRVDVLGPNPYTVFFQLPNNGTEKFSSACKGIQCARIITSYYYPYQWEYNCKGVDVGYVSTASHYVFDNHDNSECNGISWSSSLYPAKRALYGYTGTMGIYPNQQGLLLVR